ncbi:hypothetical protein V6Z12_A01G044500 [Gossypium hirsutum]
MGKNPLNPFSLSKIRHPNRSSTAASSATVDHCARRSKLRKSPIFRRLTRVVVEQRKRCAGQKGTTHMEERCIGT